MKLKLMLLAASVAALPTLASAQSTTGMGAANGAATGGAVAGPLGAVVGGTVGAAVGAGLEIPSAVINSVEEVDSPSVVYRGPVVIGERLQPAVVLRPVPSDPTYRYAVVNEQRVIVEPRTRKIVYIVD